MVGIATYVPVYADETELAAPVLIKDKQLNKLFKCRAKYVKPFYWQGNVRRSFSQIMEKKWKFFHGDNCPNCGDALEVLSECPEEEDSDFETFAFDGEEVRCVAQCGFKSGIEVTEGGAAYVQEGNLEELEGE